MPLSPHFLTAAATTIANTTTILPPDIAYIPFEIWLPVAIAPFLLLYLSLWPGIRAHDLWATLAFVGSAAAAYLSTAITFTSTHTEVINETIYIIPVETIASPPFLPYLFLTITLISILNLVRVVWEDYFRPVRDQKLLESGEMPPLR